MQNLEDVVLFKVVFLTLRTYLKTMLSDLKSTLISTAIIKCENVSTPQSEKLCFHLQAVFVLKVEKQTYVWLLTSNEKTYLNSIFRLKSVLCLEVDFSSLSHQNTLKCVLCCRWRFK